MDVCIARRNFNLFRKMQFLQLQKRNIHVPDQMDGKDWFPTTSMDSYL